MKAIWKAIIEFYSFKEDEIPIFICLRVIPTIIGFFAALFIAFTNSHSSDSISAIMIGIIGGVVTGFISIYIVGLPLMIGWSFIEFLANSMGLYFTEKSRINHKIAKLQKNARRKRLLEKALEVLNRMGSDYGSGRFFEDSKLRISRGDGSHVENATIEIPTQKEDWKLVFNANKKEDCDYHHTDTTLEPTGDGGYKISEGSTFTTNHRIIITVESYIPGDWEEHLDKLYTDAKEMQKELGEKAKKKESQKELEDFKRKFGLD